MESLEHVVIFTYKIQQLDSVGRQGRVTFTPLAVIRYTAYLGENKNTTWRIHERVYEVAKRIMFVSLFSWHLSDNNLYLLTNEQ